MKQARSISKGKFNGKSVKFFELWENVNGCWLFRGKYYAPAKVANKNLVEFAENK